MAVCAPRDRSQREAFGDAIGVSDTAGIITLWNPAEFRMFGYSEAEALGQSLDIIIPERMRQPHWEGYVKTMETGVTKYGHDCACRRSARSARTCRSPSRWRCCTTRRKVSAIASIMRDETERFHKDRAMRRRLDELERLVCAK